MLLVWITKWTYVSQPHQTYASYVFCLMISMQFQCLKFPVPMGFIVLHCLMFLVHTKTEIKNWFDIQRTSRVWYKVIEILPQIWAWINWTVIFKIKAYEAPLCLNVWMAGSSPIHDMEASTFASISCTWECVTICSWP